MNITIPAQVVPLLLKAKKANKNYLSRELAEKHLQDLVVRPRNCAPPEKIRSDVRITAEDWNGWRVYTVSPTAAPARSFIYLHGGGWVHEISKAHWRFIEHLVGSSQVRMIVPIYPLIQEGGLADDVVDRTVRLVQEHGPDTGLIGDSAGAQIAFAAALRLRDVGHIVPSTILISPPIDLELRHAGLAQRASLDPWLNREGLLVFSEKWLGEKGFDDPQLNPINADPTGLGPIAIFTGTYDILNLDARDWADKLRAAGVEVTFREEAGHVHVYPLLPTKAGRKTREEIVQLLKDCARSPKVTVGA